jgi:hypothetical protein
MAQDHWQRFIEYFEGDSTPILIQFAGLAADTLSTAQEIEFCVYDLNLPDNVRINKKKTLSQITVITASSQRHPSLGSLESVNIPLAAADTINLVGLDDLKFKDYGWELRITDSGGGTVTTNSGVFRLRESSAVN